MLLNETKTNDELLKEILEFGKEFNKQDGLKGFFAEYKNRSDNLNVITNNELQSILNDPLYKRNIENNTFELKKKDFGWNSNLVYKIQEMSDKNISSTDSLKI